MAAADLVAEVSAAFTVAGAALIAAGLVVEDLTAEGSAAAASEEGA